MLSFYCHTLPQSRKNVENNKSQVVYDDLKLNGNKVLWIKKTKSLLDQIGLGKLCVKADYMDIGIFNITRQRLEDTSN